MTEKEPTGIKSSNFIGPTTRAQLPYLGKNVRCDLEGVGGRPSMCFNNPNRFGGIEGFVIKTCWDCAELYLVFDTDSEISQYPLVLRSEMNSNSFKTDSAPMEDIDIKDLNK
jgi:hypothetical protein